MKTGIMLTTMVLSLWLASSAYAVEGSFEGDIDCDFDVDTNDLSILTSYWLFGDCNEPDWCGHADLDRNHEVNLADFAIQARDWMKRIRSIQSHSAHTEGVRGPKISCVTHATSVGAIFRNNTANMCAGSMCHDGPAPPAGSSYDATGNGWGTYLEYFRL